MPAIRSDVILQDAHTRRHQAGDDRMGEFHSTRLEKDGSLHFCVDYRQLNSIIVRDSYALPRMENFIDLLGRATVLVTPDASLGYWKIEIDP